MFKEKNILVAGGTGTIGIQVVKKLKKKQANITVVSMDEEKFAKKVLGPDILFKKIDLTDLNNCKKAVKNQDMVFNLVGIKGSVGIGETKRSYLTSQSFNQFDGSLILRGCKNSYLLVVFNLSSI